MGRCLESRTQPSLSGVLLFLIGPLPDDVPRDEHNDRLNKNTPPDWVLLGDRGQRYGDVHTQLRWGFFYFSMQAFTLMVPSLYRRP